MFSGILMRMRTVGRMKELPAFQPQGSLPLKNCFYLFLFTFYFLPLNLRISLGRIVRYSTCNSTLSLLSLPALTLSSRQTYLEVSIKCNLKASRGDSCSPSCVVPGDPGGQLLLVPSNFLLSLIFCLWSL